MFKRKASFGRKKAQITAERAGSREAAGAAAVALLARRDFCSAELGEKLGSEGYQPEIVAEVLQDLMDRHLIDDDRYASQFIGYRAGRGHGPARIRQDMAAIGLSSALIDAALSDPGYDWARCAREVRIRKFGPEPPSDWQDRARQARFLQYRGFSNDHIRSAFGPDLELESD